ncbi:MAG: hypothetical protein AB8B82_01705 [Roseovarius sp.]
MSRPLVAGDPVDLHLNGHIHHTHVLALVPWAWIMVGGPDGQLYLEVVISKSAVSWSRLVRLTHDVDPTDLDSVAQIANAIAHNPHRTDVDDIMHATKLLPPTDQIKLARL